MNSTIQSLAHIPVLLNAAPHVTSLCGCGRCPLCYLGSRPLSSYELTDEHKAGYPEWMVNCGLPMLNKTLNKAPGQELSAHREVMTNCTVLKALLKMPPLHKLEWSKHGCRKMPQTSSGLG